MGNNDRPPFEPTDILDWCMRVAHTMIERGYAKALFTWLEWVTLTSVFWAAAKASGSIVLFVVSASATVVLLFVSIAAVEKSRDEYLDKLPAKHWIGWVVMLSSLLLMGIIVGVLTGLGAFRGAA